NSPGYTMEIAWFTNLKNLTTDKIKAKCSVLAYMDNTLWVASSQAELNNIISIAKSFYNMANIQVNPSKSILATIHKLDTYTPTIFNNQPLLLQPKHQPFKFLGCWFTLDNKQTQQTQLIKTESLSSLILQKE